MINQTYRRYVFGILLSVPDYIVPVIRQGGEDGSIHTDCPEEIADLMMLLTDVWANPIIFPMSEEQMVRRIELINDMFKPFGIELFHDVSGNVVFDSDHVVSADDRTGTSDRKSHILCHVYRHVRDSDRAGNLWWFV